jgi:hypothetical protein
VKPLGQQRSLVGVLIPFAAVDIGVVAAGDKSVTVDSIAVVAVDKSAAVAVAGPHC